MLQTSSLGFARFAQRADAVGEDLALHRLFLLGRDRQLRIARDHVTVDALEHIGAIGFRDPDDIRDHVHRERVGDVVHELAFAAREDPRNDCPGARADLLLDAPDHARRETPVDQAAQPAVGAPVR